jgi:hypothetical protein
VTTHVNDNDLPVCLFLVEQCHDTKDLDLLDLTGVADQLADLADVQRVIVTLGLRLGVNNIRVFPCLRGLVTCEARLLDATYFGESTIVPEVALVGEAVANKPKLAFLDILLDRVQELVFGDLLR